MRARPTADGQRHLVFDPPAEADPDTDPWSALVARLADSGELDVVVELARAGDHPEVADVPDLEEDQPGLHRAVREVCEELDPDSLPPVRGLEAVQRLPGPLAHRVLTQALPIARAQLSADTNGVVRPLSDRPDDPVLADHLDIACQTVLDQLTKGA